MRIWAVSDLHLSNLAAGDPPSPKSFPDADVCIVAGDVSERLEDSVRWLAENFAVTMPVLFVPGNHEFYDRPLPMRSRLRDMFALYEPRVFVLDREVVELGGVRFAGATFWSDLDLYAFGDEDRLEQTRQEVARHSADCSWIEMSELRRNRVMQPDDMIALHQRDREWLDGVLASPFPGPTVVVTHHAPHHQSVADPNAGLLDTAAYASDQTALIEHHRPALWIHGHTHHSCDYSIGPTRVFSNQLGQNGESTGAHLARVIEVGPAVSPGPQLEVAGR